MSKKNDNKKDEVDKPVSFAVEKGNLEYTIALKDKAILDLQKINNDYLKERVILESEIMKLKKENIRLFKLEKESMERNIKMQKMENEIKLLNEQKLDENNKKIAEINLIEKNYNIRINQLKSINDGFTQKVSMANQLIIDKKKLEEQIINLTKENEILKKEKEEYIQKKEVSNQIKFNKLKKKMLNSIVDTQKQISELNMKNMDVSTKLTILQNNQIMMQMDYLSNLLEDTKKQKEELERELFNCKKEIEIHKEVEVSLADKNRKFKKELNLYKNKNASSLTSVDNNINMNESQISIDNKLSRVPSSLSKIESQPLKHMTNRSKSVLQENSSTTNINIAPSHSTGINSSPRNTSAISDNSKIENIMKIEKKNLELNQKLIEKSSECSVLNEKLELAQTKLKDYKKKYNGLFSFFEENLNEFFQDEDLKSLPGIFVNIDSLQKGDFNSLTKEEKYSVLIILMKYLMPLIGTSDSNFSSKIISQDSSCINQVKLKFHSSISKKYSKENLTKLKKISRNFNKNNSSLIGEEQIKNENNDFIQLSRSVNRSSNLSSFKKKRFVVQGYEDNLPSIVLNKYVSQNFYPLYGSPCPRTEIKNN